MSKRVWIVLGGGASISGLIAILVWASINTGGNPGGLAVNSDLIESVSYTHLTLPTNREV